MRDVFAGLPWPWAGHGGDWHHQGQWKWSDKAGHQVKSKRLLKHCNIKCIHCTVYNCTMYIQFTCKYVIFLKYSIFLTGCLVGCGSLQVMRWESFRMFYEGYLLFLLSFTPFDCPDSWYVSHHQGVCCSCYFPDSWSGKFWKTKCSMFMFIFRLVTFLRFSPELHCTWPSLLYSFSPRSPLPLAKQLTHLPSLRGNYFCTILCQIIVSF